MEKFGPGWNDPPNLTYEVKSNYTGRRNVLNKRISYPTNHPPKDIAKLKLDPNLPPPMAKHKDPGNHDLVEEVVSSIKTDLTSEGGSKLEGGHDTQSSSNKIETDTNIALTEVDVVAKLLELNKQLLKKDAAEIAKKLDIFKNMMENKKISQVVVNSMNQLVQYLLMKSYDKAWDIHVSLMCDHVTEVRQWMIGVKKLINELRKN